MAESVLSLVAWSSLLRQKFHDEGREEFDEVGQTKAPDKGFKFPASSASLRKELSS